MKKNISIFSALLVLFFVFTSCKNTFNIAADWKEIPVVYGLLDADSSVQYIKIEKAFLDQHLSALQMAANPDSMYYHETLNVKIDGYDIYGNLKDRNEVFKLVNGDTLKPALTKAPGIFASSPNLFYILKKKLNANYTYYLTVTKADGSILTTSSTNLVGSSTMLVSSPLSLLYRGDYNPKVQAAFNGGANAVYCDVTLRFRYSEKDLTTSVLMHRYLDLPLFTHLAINPLTLVPEPQPTFDGRALYEFLAQEIPVNSNMQRTFEGIDFLIFGVNQNSVNYVNVQNAQAGITSGTAQLDYSNIKNGMGIFASRATKIFPNYALEAKTLDSLKMGRYTYNLGFNH